MVVRRFLFATLISTVVCSATNAERVGYSFSGKFPLPSGAYPLFGYNVPRNAVVSGTFSYDTTAPGIDVEAGKRSYHQYIDGGLTLSMTDANNVQVNISASDYVVSVSNDFGPTNVDSFSVDYVNYAIAPVPPPLVVNNVAWDVPNLGAIKVFLSWPSTKFTDADEPKLTADRPVTAGATATWFLGSATPPATGTTPRSFASGTTGFSVQALTPLVGDYNRDGKLNLSDYVEWRKAYGCTDSACLYADGNDDGIVDGGDYVIWRNAMAAGVGAEASQTSAMPEPTCNGLAAIAASTALLVGRRRSKWAVIQQVA
jgi:hypothetical protein